MTSPDSYAAVIEAAQGEGFTLEQRRELAARAFAHTATYDLAISGWLADQLDLDDVRDELDEACETHLDASDAAFLESLGFAIDEEAEEIVEADDEEGEMPAFVADAFERVDSCATARTRIRTLLCTGRFSTKKTSTKTSFCPASPMLASYMARQ